MVLYDIAKTQKIMADSRSDKELTENLFQISKKIVKEFAEDYQIIDNETKLLVDHILEFNMPDWANPLQKWHEIYDPKIDLHINEFTGEKLPPSPKSIANAPKGNSKTVKALQIFKSVNLAKNAIKSVKQPTRNRSTLKFKTSTHNLKMIDDSIIKKAIEETDWNLNLNKSEKEKKKVVLDNITILQYVAKWFALLGRKVKTSMNKHKKKTGKMNIISKLLFKILINYFDLFIILECFLSNWCKDKLYRFLCWTSNYANLNET